MEFNITLLQQEVCLVENIHLEMLQAAQGLCTLPVISKRLNGKKI